MTRLLTNDEQARFGPSFDTCIERPPNENDDGICYHQNGLAPNLPQPDIDIPQEQWRMFWMELKRLVDRHHFKMFCCSVVPFCLIMIPWGMNECGFFDDLYCSAHREACFIISNILLVVVVVQAGVLHFYNQDQESKLRSNLEEACRQHNSQSFESQHGYYVSFNEHDLGNRNFSGGGELYTLRVKVGVITFAPIPGFHVARSSMAADAPIGITTTEENVSVDRERTRISKSPVQATTSTTGFV